MKILSIGDNNVDSYPSGISYAGGNCLNLAAYAVMNGCTASYIGTVGNDKYGDLEKRSLSSIGVDISHIRTEHGSTSKDIIVSKHGERYFTEYDRTILDTHPIRLNKNELDFARSFDLIHSSVYSPFIPGAIEEIASLNIPMSYDFSVEWQTGYTQVVGSSYDEVMKYMKDNTMEHLCPLIDFGFFSCSNVSLKETKELLTKAISLGCRLAVATRGMDGSYCYDGTTFYHQKSYPAQVIDTLGAGDSFITRFLISYLQKENWLNQIICQINHSISKEDVNDYLSTAITSALADAAIFASRTCSIEGAFGYGEKI